MTTISELESAIGSLKIATEPVLLVHCSFTHLYTLAATPEDVVALMLRIVGKRGSLFMPAFSRNTGYLPPKPFIVDKQCTYTGLVAEHFRTLPGVLRSAHPRHSLCGIGPMARSILSGHEKCCYAEGQDSPMDKLRKLDNAYILMLGTRDSLTFMHWCESIEPNAFPMRAHSEEPTRCPVVLSSGEVVDVLDYQIRDGLKARVSALRRDLDKRTLVELRHKGTYLGAYHMKSLAEHLIRQRNQKHVYYSI